MTLRWYRVNEVGNLPEPAKISKEQRASLNNPDFAEYAKLCGGYGFRASNPDKVIRAIEAGLNGEGPAIVEILTDPMQT